MRAHQVRETLQQYVEVLLARAERARAGRRAGLRRAARTVFPRA